MLGAAWARCRCQRRHGFTISLRHEAVAGYAVGGEPRDDGVGAILGELLVVGVIAHVVGMSLDFERQHLVSDEQVRDLLQDGVGCGDVDCKVDLLKSKRTPSSAA